MMRKFLWIIICACALVGCREYKVSDNPTLRLVFSTDTLRFDTVFTEQGSATLQMKVYNPNRSALLIDRVWLNEGKAFRVNVDGEPDLSRLKNLKINGHDSLFVFVRVDIDPMRSNSPVLVTDQLCFHLRAGATQQVELEAYGQDVIRLGKAGAGAHQYPFGYTFKADKPYMIFDTMVVAGTLKMEAGATIYLHAGACIFAYGDIEAKGKLTQPITLCGDRIDRLFDSVPYRYAAGGWDGLYAVNDGASKRNYTMEYVDILSGNIGLYCYGEEVKQKLTMNGCRIHNHALYGLVLLNTDAQVSNTEISNCASYCVYCAGGTHDFVHSTIASYFGYTNIRIQSVAKEDAAAVYIDNLSKTSPQTITSFYNSIITGYLPNQLVVATPFDRYYPGVFTGNYLKTDSLTVPHATANTYWQASDTAQVFRNDFYKYKEYVYYDFHLDSLSPAIGIGDSLKAVDYELDRDGISRALTRPDAGCYQYHP